MSKKVKKKVRWATRIIPGIILIGIILISGTFAFVQLNQSAFNVGRVDVLAGGRVHDVWQADGPGGLRDAPGWRNKNVFAENFGNMPMGVRIRFREFAAFSNEPVVAGTSIDNPGSWPVALFDSFTQTTRGMEPVRRPGTDTAAIGSAGVNWLMGQRPDEEKYFMPTHNQVNRYLGNIGFDPDFFGAGMPFDNSIFNNDFIAQFSETSGRGIDAIAGNWRMGHLEAPDWTNANEILNWQDEVEFRGHTVDNFRGQTGYYGHTGEQGFFGPGDSRTAPRFFIDETLQPPLITVDEEYTLYARHVMEPAEGGIMTIAAWNAANMPSGNFWIMDNDGWFYWNGLIPGRDELGSLATSLLLNDIYMPMSTALDYIIQIESDLFIPGEIDANPALSDISADARWIFEEETFVVVPTSVTATGAVTRPRGNTAPRATLGTTVNRYRGDTLLGSTPAQWTAEILQSNATSTASIDGNSVVLNINPTEPLQAVTIRVSDERANNHVDIVTHMLIEGLSDLATGDRWFDSTGVPWIVLVSSADTHGGNSVLLLTEHVHGRNTSEPNLVWNTNSPGVFTPFAQSTIRTQMTNWFRNTNFVSPELRASAQTVNLGPNGGVESTMWNNATGTVLTNTFTPDLAVLSTPTGVANPNHANHIFALSRTEATTWLTSNAQRLADVFGTANTRGRWQARTPDANSTGVATIVSTGAFGGTTAQMGFRAAVWIQQ